LIGVYFGQVATVQLDFDGSMHIPDAHFRGIFFGHPLETGHLLSSVAQEPSGHNISSFSGHSKMFSWGQSFSSLTHYPLPHLKEFVWGHPFSLSQYLGSDTQNPSLHLWLKWFGQEITGHLSKETAQLPSSHSTLPNGHPSIGWHSS